MRGLLAGVGAFLVVAGVVGAHEPQRPVPFRVGSDLQGLALTPRATVITHLGPWASNSLLVELGKDHLVLVSTPYTPESTDEVLAWIRAQYPGRALTAINPHFHLDGAGGNEALIRAGVPVIGSDLTAKLIAERGARRRDYAASLVSDDELRTQLLAVPMVPPSRTFPLQQGAHLVLGGEPVDIIFPGAAHAPDNVVVHFPRQGILFGGCMVLAGKRAANLSDADVTGWARAVESLQGLRADIVIPGHGDRFDRELLENTHRIAKDLVPRTLAVTVDDLPWVGPAPEGSRSVTEAVEKLASHLTSRHVPATGFIAAGREHREALRAWIKSGMEMGNHTFSHRAYSKLSVAEYTADVLRNEEVVRQEFGVELRGTFFRYPFLDHGHTEEKVEAMARLMEQRRYTHAPVSLDTVDHLFANAYARLPDRRKTARLYVEHVQESAAHFEALSRQLHGREIPLVLLVHANELNADHLGTVLEMLESRGYRFVPLRQALSDAAYATHGNRPPLVPLKGDRNFLTQVATARGIVVDDVSGEGRFETHWRPLLEGADAGR
ncbi:MAG: polysaccharide deacetylase family protein [Myxococcota bacterium]